MRQQKITKRKKQRRQISICDELRALHISQNIFCDVMKKNNEKLRKMKRKKKGETR